MIKVVLDTNIYLSAILYGGMAKTIFSLILENKLILNVSPDLEDEILRKLKEYGADEKTMEEVKLFLNQKGISLKPKVKVTVCRDPDDNFLLELSQTAETDYLITRDKDLLELPNHKWRKTNIVRPEEFLPLLRSMKLIRAKKPLFS